MAEMHFLNIEQLVWLDETGAIRGTIYGKWATQ